MAGPVSLLKEEWNALKSEQQIAVGVFGVVAVIVLAFGLIQVRAALLNPFTTDVQTLVDLREQLGPTQEELIREQQRTDTDGDGISDYDESTVYFTSPYVRDSDSDGEPDNMEIARGTDPNCPTGKTCTATGGTEASGDAGPGLALPGATGQTTGDFGANAGVSSDFPLELPARDPAAIRAYLEANGVSAEDLASYTDAQLLDAYDQSASDFDTETGSSESSL